MIVNGIRLEIIEKADKLLLIDCARMIKNEI